MEGLGERRISVGRIVGRASRDRYNITMKHISEGFILILLLSCARSAYGFSQHGWIGGNITIDIRAPDEIKGGEVVKIEIELNIKADVDVQYFNITVNQFQDALYSKTLWQNQKLDGSFKYVENISVTTELNALWYSSPLTLLVNTKYSDSYWTYTARTSFDVGTVRIPTYESLFREYFELAANYSKIQTDYRLLSSNYTSLLEMFYSINESYEDAREDVIRLENEKWVLGIAILTLTAVVVAELGVIFRLRRRRPNL